MAKLDKVQRDYLLSRLHTEMTTAITAFKSGKPTHYTQRDVIEALRNKGFIVGDYVGNYVSLPPSKAMEKNQAAIEAFSAKASTAKSNAEAAVYLGDSEEAQNVLASFIEQLKKL